MEPGSSLQPETSVYLGLVESSPLPAVFFDSTFLILSSNLAYVYQGPSFLSNYTAK